MKITVDKITMDTDPTRLLTLGSYLPLEERWFCHKVAFLSGDRNGNSLIR